jgi:hypothetical protein
MISSDHKHVQGADRLVLNKSDTDTVTENERQRRAGRKMKKRGGREGGRGREEEEL